MKRRIISAEYYRTVEYRYRDVEILPGDEELTAEEIFEKYNLMDEDSEEIRTKEIFDDMDYFFDDED